MSKKLDQEKVRTLLHDLRASHHAANLNAQAAGMMLKKASGAESEKAGKHVNLLLNDLKKFKDQLEDLSKMLKDSF